MTETTEAPPKMGTWCGRPIPRERRLVIGIENLEAMVERSMEDLDAMKAAIAPSKRNSRFIAALERLEGRLNAAKQETLDAREVVPAP